MNIKQSLKNRQQQRVIRHEAVRHNNFHRIATARAQAAAHLIVERLDQSQEPPIHFPAGRPPRNIPSDMFMDYTGNLAVSLASLEKDRDIAYDHDASLAATQEAAYKVSQLHDLGVARFDEAVILVFNRPRS